MKNSIYILLTMLLSSCIEQVNEESKWQIRESDDLRHYQLSFDDIILLGPKHILLFGEENTEENHQLMRDQQNLYHTGFAVVYTTKDGGQTWKKQSFEKGGNWSTDLVGNTIFATKIRNNGRVAEKSIVLYRSNDSGTSWEVVNEFVGMGTFIALDENASGWIGGRIKEDSTVQKHGMFYELERGKITHETNLFEGMNNSVRVGNDLLFFKRSEKKGERNILQILNIESRMTEELWLPKGLDGYFADKQNSEVYVVGSENGKCCLYTKSSKQDFNLIHCFESLSEERVFPKSLKVHGDNIAIVIGIRKSMWTENTTFFSSNGGKTWQEEKLPKAQYFSPFDFLKSEKGLFGFAYSGSGTFQVRQFDD